MEKKSLKQWAFTERAKIDGHDLYLSTTEFADGKLWEIYIDMSEEDSTVRALLQSWAISISLGLQNGVPLEVYRDRFSYTDFPPSGKVEHTDIKSAKSVLSLVFKLLEPKYLNKTPTRLSLRNQDSIHQAVYVYLPSQEVSIIDGENLTNACGDFMESLGYEIKATNEPILGSFFQKLIFKLKNASNITKAEVVEDFAKGKKALELKYVDLPTAEQTEKLANSASKIIELLSKQDEGIIRLGALLVLKKNINGQSKIFIHQLDFHLIEIFDKNPKLLYNLQTVYELITGDVEIANKIDNAKMV